MRKINIAIKLSDFRSELVSTIDNWFNAVTSRFNIQDLAAYPLVGDVPKNQWGLWKNTTTGNVRLIANDEGTLKSVELTTGPTNVNCVQARLTASQSLASGAFTKVNLTNERFDTGGEYNPVTVKFTAGVNGYYQLHAQIAIDLSAFAGSCTTIVAFFINGVQSSEMFEVDNAASGTYTPAVSTLRLLNAGDTVEVYAFQNSGGSRNILAGEDTHFDAFLVRTV